MKISTASLCNVVICTLLVTGHPSAVAQSAPFTISISESRISKDGVFVKITIRNVSSHKIRVLVGVPYRTSISDENGKHPSQKQGSWIGSPDYMTIEPDRFIADFANLSSEFDLSIPGKYYVRLSLPIDEEDPKSKTVTSNEIALIIPPPNLVGSQ